MSCTAVAEFGRLKGSTVYKPDAPVKAMLVTNRSIRYVFRDGSRLYLYSDGSATCERNATEVIQHCADWHKCSIKDTVS